MNKQQLITDLQSQGLRVEDGAAGAAGRRGGAGPSDHKAVTIDGTTVMVPIYTGAADQSPYSVQSYSVQSYSAPSETTRLPAASEQPSDNSHAVRLQREAVDLGAAIAFPPRPRFYDLATADGTPYWKIALLHSRDVLATTVLQTCMRYRDPATACQFCAIENSLTEGRTVARKHPEQLAEVAAAAVALDGVTHMVMTTGTPSTPDRGAAHLAACAQAVKARVSLPIQAQCEPPDDFGWFARLKAAGVDSLGMHLEAVDPEVRAKIMPGKAEIPVSRYFEAFAAAVAVFGWGQVSTYLLAGLGDSVEGLTAACDRLIDMGVYPFVVPFVPITGTSLAHHPAPTQDFMTAVYRAVGSRLRRAGMSSAQMNAGCGKCGACSALSLFE
ncbi:MAG: MSMEG_0568 family radical SAM protein [Elainellaceae cyanobacterium]